MTALSFAGAATQVPGRALRAAPNGASAYARGAVKPNPALLLQIVRDVEADLQQVVYVGDSLMKDVAMAQHAGIADVWARYGEVHRREEYELLRRVSHWTPEDVERERQLKREDLNPTHTIDTFTELESLFSFRSKSA